MDQHFQARINAMLELASRQFSIGAMEALDSFEYPLLKNKVVGARLNTIQNDFQPCTDTMNTAVALAFREVLLNRIRFISPTHILFGMLTVANSVAFQVLSDFKDAYHRTIADLYNRMEVAENEMKLSSIHQLQLGMEISPMISRTRQLISGRKDIKLSTGHVLLSFYDDSTSHELLLFAPDRKEIEDRVFGEVFLEE